MGTMFLKLRPRHASLKMSNSPNSGYRRIWPNRGDFEVESSTASSNLFNLRFCDEKIIRLEIRYVEQYSFSCSFRKSYF